MLSERARERKFANKIALKYITLHWTSNSTLSRKRIYVCHLVMQTIAWFLWAPLRMDFKKNNNHNNIISKQYIDDNYCFWCLNRNIFQIEKMTILPRWDCEDIEGKDKRRLILKWTRCLGCCVRAHWKDIPRNLWYCIKVWNTCLAHERMGKVEREREIRS